LNASSKREWRHRTRVYKYGDIWYWKCSMWHCAEGGTREHLRTFLAASTHTFLGGYSIGNGIAYPQQPLHLVTHPTEPQGRRRYACYSPYS
jgi:hypothetical protein